MTSFYYIGIIIILSRAHEPQSKINCSNEGMNGLLNVDRDSFFVQFWLPLLSNRKSYCYVQRCSKKSVFAVFVLCALPSLPHLCEIGKNTQKVYNIRTILIMNVPSSTLSFKMNYHKSMQHVLCDLNKK